MLFRSMPQPGELPEGFDPENMPPMPPMGMMPDFDENNDKSENASAEKKQRDGSDRKNIRYRKDSFTKGYWKSSKTDSVRIDFRNPESSFIAKFEIDSAKNKCIIIIPVFAVNPDGLAKPKKLALGFISANTNESASQSGERPDRTSVV